MNRIAIIGPGAIGGTVIVRLAQVKEHDVVVCARSAVSEFVLETPEGNLTAKPQILFAPGEAPPVDWILVATKTYDTATAARWFPSLTGPATRLAILQNGVEHIQRFTPYFPGSQIVPVVVDLPVERQGPGAFRQRRAGHFTVPANPNGQDFARLFDQTGIETILTADFKTALWRKLAVNCAGAVSALVLKPSVVTRRLDIADILRGLVRECVLVGRAEGAVLEDAVVESVVERYQKSAPDSVNSLHADRIAKRPMEIDIRNGVIVRLGRKHGIPTPVNQMIVALLEAAME